MENNVRGGALQQGSSKGQKGWKLKTGWVSLPQSKSRKNGLRNERKTEDRRRASAEADT